MHKKQLLQVFHLLIILSLLGFVGCGSSPKKKDQPKSPPIKKEKINAKASVKDSSSLAKEKGNVRPRSPRSPKRRSRGGQNGVTTRDAVAVYKFPNFDSPVLDYLQAGKKVRISKKVYKGIGGFGAFFKVRLKKRVYGYVADVDVVPEFTKKKVGQQVKVKENPQFEQTRNQQIGREPIYFTRYLGGSVGMVNYTEKFSGQELSSDTLMFGLKMSGPGVLIDGPPIDFNLTFSIAPPSYYEDFTASPSGFFVNTDIQMLLPLLAASNNMFYIGAGPMLTFNKFSLVIRNTSFDSQELRLGLVATLGFAQRFKSWAVRLEGKYHYETTDYFGYSLSVQKEY